MKNRFILTFLIISACKNFLWSQNDSLFKPLRLVGITSIISGDKYRSINTGPNISLYYKNHEIGAGILVSGFSVDAHKNGTRGCLFSYQYFFIASHSIKMGVFYTLLYQTYTSHTSYNIYDPIYPTGILYVVKETNTFLENYIGGCLRETIFKHFSLEQFIGIGLNKFTYSRMGHSPFIGNEKINSSYFAGMFRIGIGYKF